MRMQMMGKMKMAKQRRWITITRPHYKRDKRIVKGGFKGCLMDGFVLAGKKAADKAPKYEQ